MKDVASMYVMQWRVFAPDVIPYRLIVTPLGTNLLMQAFGFRDPNWNQETSDYVFQDGTLEHESGIIPITWLSFSDRRIAIQVFADSDAANLVYSTVSSKLAELAPGIQGADPVVIEEETSCVARLDFEWPSLLNAAFVGQIAELAKQVSTVETRRVIKGVSIRFTLGSVATGERIGDYGITLSDKTVAIEPKANVPLSERSYFTYSPCDSGTHLKLVAELEATLKGNKGKKLPKRGASR